MKGGSSARELIVLGRHKKPVITFCREIDGMLGGGVPRGELTEVRLLASGAGSTGREEGGEGRTDVGF